METVDELTIEYEENGEVLTKELDKAVLSKGAWATVVFLYQDRNRRTGEFGPPKIGLRRYRKMRGVYRLQGRFNISSIDQASKLVDVLERWIAEQREASA